MKRGVLDSYGDRLPLTPQTPRISLGEGGTPLVRSRRLARAVGTDELYFKLEGCNPTGSFKDRGMVVAIAKAIEEQKRIVLCASTGNTSASAAAYAAYTDLEAVVLVPGGNIAFGKLAQALMYGAKVVAINANFDVALELVKDLTRRHPVALVNSVNPYRIEGQKTAAFEIVDDLGDAPDYLFIPVGNAGNITAYWKGFREEREARRSTRLPRMMGSQASGAAPIVLGAIVEEPQTVATAIRIGNPASWKGALAARDESGGSIGVVTDEEILEAYGLLAGQEGLFVEPASAASVAGLLKRAREGMDFSAARIVCVLTGNGLKDPDTAKRQIARGVFEVGGTLSEVEQALGW